MVKAHNSLVCHPRRMLGSGRLPEPDLTIGDQKVNKRTEIDLMYTITGRLFGGL